MNSNRPEPGAVINFGEPTVPRLAATVVLVRGGDSRLELLLVQRGQSARVMAGAWVFPGGSVDAADGEGSAALAAAARRELLEEAGVTLAADDELLPFARWITPPEVRYRFDTWFFIGSAPENVVIDVDGSEIVDHIWITPGDALAAHSAGRLSLVFPTIKQLERLGRLGSAQAALSHARGHAVEAVQPRMVEVRDGEFRILIPGDPGYAD